MSVREKATKLTAEGIFTWKTFCDWKFLPANFCIELYAACLMDRKKLNTFVLKYHFPLLGKNSTCLIKTWWVIARLLASSVTAPGYHQLAALVHLLGSWQAAAEQTLHRRLLYLPHVSLVGSMGREKGKLTPQKQSLKSDRTDTTQVVWRCGEGL